jgi:peptidoglycan/xylan/chitin deacetylase (PgdA/CDA1 family)
MKKRGSDDFPFDDLAGARRSFRNDSVEPTEAREDNIPVRQTVPFQQRATQQEASLRAKQPLRQDERINTGNAYIPEYERSAPRPRTLNRQIQILSLIAAILFMIILVLIYLVFSAGNNASGATDVTTRAITTTVLTAKTTSGAKESQTSGTSAAGASNNTSATTDASGISVTPASTKSTDPNSLANLPPSKEHPVIALTFDDGPSKTLTPKLLGILEAKGVHVTFFMLGQMVIDADPAILKRMAADGDELGNHTYDHSPLNKMTADQVRSELTKTNDAIFAAAGVYPTVIRPPDGESSDTVLAVSKEMKLPVINWSWQVCPEDWLTKNQNPDYIAKFVIDNAANGRIVLLHDIHSTTVDAISAMIDGLVAKGYRFATISELLAAQPTGEKTGVLYYQANF